MLGLTTTPYRLDQKNIYAICDFNSVYEVDLFSAINRGWLVPYKYYGIYDATVNYDKIRYINGRYVEKDLENALSINIRAELIYKHYLRYRRNRALAFCTSINHAEFMAEYFNNKGIKSVCIHSDNTKKHYCERKSGINALEKNEIEIVFSVDMLNEGVDIPSLDLLLFLRPTESPTVFLQQLGRGLRLFEGKKDVRVLDFIGNFKKIDLIPLLLGRKNLNNKDLIRLITQNDFLPLDCQVDFEFEIVDLLEKALRSKKKVKDYIKEWYFSCKEENSTNNYIPTRQDFFTWLDEEKYRIIKSNSKLNPFKDYLLYIKDWEQEFIEDDFFATNEYKFINFIENTSMSQLYKLPVLLSFIDNDKILNTVNKDRLIKTFKEFYKNNRNRLDLTRNKHTVNTDSFTDEKWWRIIRDNPIKFLCYTNSDIFEFDGKQLRIKLDFNWCNKTNNNNQNRTTWFINQIKDAIAFRRSDFLNSRLEKN